MTNEAFAAGVAIIAKYVATYEHGCQAEHGQLWFGGFGQVTNERDREFLLSLGWFRDEDAWSCFL